MEQWYASQPPLCRLFHAVHYRTFVWAYFSKQTLRWRTSCFADAEKLQLEMYLCVVQDRCSSARLIMSTPSLHEYNISVLLDLMYVLWVEQKQLQRGARFLAKVSC